MISDICTTIWHFPTVNLTNCHIQHICILHIKHISFPPFPPAGKCIRRESPTASRQTTLWICLVRSASPSPRPQSSCSLLPQGELLKFLETFLCFVTKHPRCSDKTKDLLLFSSLTELRLKGLDECKKPWTDIDLINRVFCCKQTALSGTVIPQSS